jgi:hypothetical protein
MISFFFERKANPEESKEPLARLFGHLSFGYAIRVTEAPIAQWPIHLVA